MHLRVRLFGPFEARLGEHSRLLHFPAEKTELLMGYLLVNRETRHPRDRLACVWWGDRDTRHARHCLNTALWRLRQVLDTAAPGQAAFLIVDDHGIGFNTASDYWLDVEEFETRCAHARYLESCEDDAVANALKQAIALYRDDLLPSCYDEWCLVERQRLQQLYLFALSRLAAFHNRRNQFDESIVCCQKILACDPLREEVHRDLIRLYLSANRPQEALRQFMTCATILKRELGIEPMDETLAVIHKLPKPGLDDAFMDTQQIAPQPVAQSVPAKKELQNILISLSIAAETVTLASTQLRQVLQSLEQCISRRDH